MFPGRGRERPDIGRFARKVGRNGRSAGEDRACRSLVRVSKLDSDGIDSDLGSMFVGSNQFLLSRVWFGFALPVTVSMAMTHVLETRRARLQRRWAPFGL
jgi:hypothetical protein